MFDQLPLLRSSLQMRSRLRSWRAFGERVALIPMVGPVHEGHLALLATAQREGMRTVACLVDLPGCGLGRDLEADADRLDAAQADAVYATAGARVSPADCRTRLSIAGLTDVLCGAVEPGCFDAALLVLVRLMNQMQADLMLVADAHWQAGIALAQLAGDLDLPTEVRLVPALRDADGLAVSSESLALPPDLRARAGRFARALAAAARDIKAGACPSGTARRAREALATQGFSRIDYLEVRHAGTLAPMPDPAVDGPARVFGAVRLGGLRIADSVPVV